MSQTPTAPVRYPANSAFWDELSKSVDSYFQRAGISRAGGVRLWLKTGIILAWLAVSYALLVFWADTWWQALPLITLVSCAVAGVGFNIQHDGGHDAYATSRRGNRLAAFALDLMGGSSYVWRFKHAVVHHHYTNITGVDEDIDSEPFLRLSPHQRWHRLHRWQHWYAWLLFGFLPPKWTFYDDFRAMFAERVGSQRMPKPRPFDVAVFLTGKLAFVFLVLGLPLLAGHSLLTVVGFYAIYALVTGILISVVFQLAHCVEEAEFLEPPVEGEKMPRPWSEHQLATTVDFAPRNRFLTWFLGGLNFQVEHHLFPRVSHVHYPALSQIVKETCARFGLTHRSHPGFFPALASHMRHLARLGRPSPAV